MKADFDKQFLNSSLLTQQIKQGLESDVIWINDGKFEQFQWKQILLNLKSYKGRSLYMNRNHSQILLKSIENIEFINLSMINLGNNRINNIQSLVLIRMPNLSCLNLFNNRITNMKSLTKLSTFNLKELFIQNNYVNQLHLNRMKVNDSFNMLNIEGDMNHLLQIESIEFVFKFQPKMNNFSILNSSRVRQNKIYSMIKIKNQKINLFEVQTYFQLLQRLQQ